MDLFTCQKLLRPRTKDRIELIRARPNFYMLSDNSNVSMKIVDFSLLTRRIKVIESYQQYMQWNLAKEHAHYNYMETIAKTFIIPSRQNQLIQEDVFKTLQQREKLLQRIQIQLLGDLIMKILPNINIFIRKSLEFFIVEVELFD